MHGVCRGNLFCRLFVWLYVVLLQYHIHWAKVNFTGYVCFVRFMSALGTLLIRIHRQLRFYLLNGGEAGVQWLGERADELVFGNTHGLVYA